MAHAIEPFIENVGKGWGWMSQMAILANNIWMILTGQAGELERQAKLEGELADLKKEQARAELEAQELADKRNKTFEEMQQQLADELQGYYDRHNEEERLADIQFERLLNEKDITEEQKQQLRNQREFNKREQDRMEAERKAEEEAKKMAEDEKKEQRKIDDEYRKELEEIDKEAKRRTV
jgi:colicin import membrane protein